MKCNLIFEDWRQTGQADSIYNTSLGFELSFGDLHSGTGFKATVVFEDAGIGREIEDAYQRHGAYPVFRLVADAVEREEGGGE